MVCLRQYSSAAGACLSPFQFERTVPTVMELPEACHFPEAGSVILTLAVGSSHLQCRQA